MLRGKNVILRQVREADLADFLSLSNDYFARGDYWPGGLIPEIKARNEFKETGWWEEEKGTLLITDLEDCMLGKLIFWKPAGYIQAFEIGGIIFHPEYRGQGLMNEALPLLISWLFDTKRMDRLQATHLIGNEVSKAVLQKAGMTYEATLRQAVFHRGKTHDLAMYAIVRRDLNAG